MKRVDTLRPRDEAEDLRRRYDELTAITARLIKECWRLQADNEDLRASAKLWISMYEQQLERANFLDEQLHQGPRRG
jgi:hypothetical protein